MVDRTAALVPNGSLVECDRVPAVQSDAGSEDAAEGEEERQEYGGDGG